MQVLTAVHACATQVPSQPQHSQSPVYQIISKFGYLPLLPAGIITPPLTTVTQATISDWNQTSLTHWPMLGAGTNAPVLGTTLLH
jgi:hypothetical protein